MLPRIKINLDKVDKYFIHQNIIETSLYTMKCLLKYLHIFI